MEGWLNLLLALTGIGGITLAYAHHQSFPPPINFANL